MENFLKGVLFLGYMAKRIGSTRRKTRQIFSKSKKQRGKISIAKLFKEYKNGDKVVLKAEPSVQKGLYFRRFHGKVGVVREKKGSCYEVVVKDFKKEKSLIVNPVHMKKV